MRGVTGALGRVDLALGKVLDGMARLADDQRRIGDGLAKLTDGQQALGKDVADLKVGQRALEKDVAELKGRVSQLPGTLQLIGFVLAVLAIAGVTRFFAPH